MNNTALSNYNKIVTRIPPADCPFEFKQVEDRCLMFLIDGSKSISPNEFLSAKAFIYSMIELAAGTGILNTKILQFADFAHLILDWNTNMGPNEIINRMLQINDMKQDGGNSDIMKGLKTAGQFLQNYKYKTLVLLTDGISNKQTLEMVQFFTEYYRCTTVPHEYGASSLSHFFITSVDQSWRV